MNKVNTIEMEMEEVIPTKMEEAIQIKMEEVIPIRIINLDLIVATMDTTIKIINILIIVKINLTETNQFQ